MFVILYKSQTDLSPKKKPEDLLNDEKAMQETAVQANLDYRNLRPQNEQDSNFATVSILYTFEGKLCIRHFHGRSEGDNKNTEFHAERRAWKEAKRSMNTLRACSKSFIVC